MSPRKALAAGLTLVAASTSATATAADKPMPRFPNGTDVCLDLGPRHTEKPINGSLLTGPAAGFGGLDTRFTYHLVLQGKYVVTNRKDTNNKPVLFFEHFKPTRFALTGKTTAETLKHPKGKNLISRTEVRLDSEKTDVSYGINFGLSQSGPSAGFSVSFDPDHHTTVVRDEVPEARKKRVVSMFASGVNPVMGSAAESTGLYRIRARSYVGVDGFNPAPTVDKQWKIKHDYVRQLPEAIPGVDTCPAGLTFTPVSS